MYDIEFYMKFDKILQKIVTKKITDSSMIVRELEKIRNINPIIYNIETTNACNMRCQMCPRTTKMTRKIENMPKELFDNIINQIKPHNEYLWEKWIHYCENKYNIYENEMNENAFFLYIISKVIQLHGFGDPLLDDNMPYYIDKLSLKEIPSYFSCNPVNINLETIQEMMKNGLGYIKFSIESTDDNISMAIRGNRRNRFEENYKNIYELMEYKYKWGLETQIVITMIDLNRKNQNDDFFKLCEKFQKMNIYIYLKSENSQWVRKINHKNTSIHWNEVCKHPWISMTIKSNGDAVMCMEDYNNEIVLGNIAQNSLKEIWNGENYNKLRKSHIEKMYSKNKCYLECDMKKIKNLLE